MLQNSGPNAEQVHNRIHTGDPYIWQVLEMLPNGGPNASPVHVMH